MPRPEARAASFRSGLFWFCSAHDGAWISSNANSAEQCLEANLCRILAQQVTSPQLGEMLDQIANIWERMATNIDAGSLNPPTRTY
jgi:hypothetical protein